MICLIRISGLWFVACFSQAETAVMFACLVLLPKSLNACVSCKTESQNETLPTPSDWLKGRERKTQSQDGGLLKLACMHHWWPLLQYINVAIGAVYDITLQTEKCKLSCPNMHENNRDKNEQVLLDAAIYILKHHYFYPFYNLSILFCLSSP